MKELINGIVCFHIHRVDYNIPYSCIKGTNNYNQQRANGKNPSILTSNPNKLLKDAVGKGQSYGNNKVVVDYGKNIGKFYDIRTGKYYDTTRATIHYDNKGNAHIVPAKPKWLK